MKPSQAIGISFDPENHLLLMVDVTPQIQYSRHPQMVGLMEALNWMLGNIWCLSINNQSVLSNRVLFNSSWFAKDVQNVTGHFRH